MADELSDRVVSLKTQVDQRRAEQMRVEAEVAAASAEYERALAKLLEEFGVGTLDAGRELLASLEAQVVSEADRVQSELAVANGSS